MSVSYTHLGYVDKKTDSLDQALSWIDDAKRKGENVSIAVIGNAATAVSYTHLDVYKRQALR